MIVGTDTRPLKYCTLHAKLKAGIIFAFKPVDHIEGRGPSGDLNYSS